MRRHPTKSGHAPVEHSRLSGWTVAAATGLLALAGGLRLGRALARWDEVALAYSAYQAPVVDALTDPRRLAGAFVGLHPPLYGVFYAIMEHLAPAPVLFLLFSAACSWLVVPLVGAAAWRFGRLPALVAMSVAAVSPLGLHYAAEVNNYPLLMALIAAMLLARMRWDREGGWLPLALLGVAAGWTHILGGVVAGVLVLSMAPRDRAAALKAGAALAVGTSAVVVGALRLAGDDHTFGQPPLLLGQSLLDWQERFGIGVIPLGLLAMAGLGRRALVPALTWAALAGATTAMVLLGVAAPHQFPYWSLLLPSAALLVGAGVARWRPLVLPVAILVAVNGGIALVELRGDLGSIQADQRRVRAVDVALERASPGDAIWLISPALMPDDDKRATAPVLWRLRPWVLQPMFRPFPMDYTDYRFGQPRRYGELVVHTFTDFWPDRMDALLTHHGDAGTAVWVVLYDHGPARRYPESLREVLRSWVYTEQPVGADHGLGVDLLFRVSGAREPENVTGDEGVHLRAEGAGR